MVGDFKCDYREDCERPAKYRPLFKRCLCNHHLAKVRDEYEVEHKINQTRFGGLNGW